MTSRARRLLTAFASCSVRCLGATAASASAAAPDSQGQSCPASAASQPFTQWGDQSTYVLVPGGDFESSAWTLQSGAALVRVLDGRVHPTDGLEALLPDLRRRRRRHQLSGLGLA